MGPLPLLSPNPLLDRPRLRRRLLGPGIQAEGVAGVDRAGFRCWPGVRGVQRLVPETGQRGREDPAAMKEVRKGVI